MDRAVLSADYFAKLFQYCSPTPKVRFLSSTCVKKPDLSSHDQEDLTKLTIGIIFALGDKRHIIKFTVTRLKIKSSVNIPWSVKKCVLTYTGRIGTYSLTLENVSLDVYIAHFCFRLHRPDCNCVRTTTKLFATFPHRFCSHTSMPINSRSWLICLCSHITHFDIQCRSFPCLLSPYFLCVIRRIQNIKKTMIVENHKS